MLQPTKEALLPTLIRRARPEDVSVSARICFEAFRTISNQHNFPPDLPVVEIPLQLLAMMFSHGRFYCVVAEVNGQIVGSNCLDERSVIAGVGPITVDPNSQNSGVGRMLMDAVLTRVKEKGFAGVRLIQAAFHNRSLSLYARLGFEIREPLSTMQGPPIKQLMEGYRIRAAEVSDLNVCENICRKVHGHERTHELREAIADGSALVAEYHGRITAYTTALAFFGHSVAESNRDLEALIASAEKFGGSGILVPNRNTELFRWCLDHGLRVVQPMTLMSKGLYNEPHGAFLPSISF